MTDYRRIEFTLGYYPLFEKGGAIANAKIFVGEPDTDPTVIANQKTVFVIQETNFPIPVSQPIETDAGGVPQYAGTPAMFAFELSSDPLADTSYSMEVQDSGGSKIYYIPSSQELSYEPKFDILPINKGGTNSGTALVNDKIMASFGGQIIESSLGIEDVRFHQGMIMMWSGDIGTIPAGWVLCDGTNGTPDLRNRFMVGAGDEYNPDDIGGEKEHALTSDENGLHSHSSGAASANGGQYLTGSAPIAIGDTGSSGLGDPHENRPPYYALAFIMKT